MVHIHSAGAPTKDTEECMVNRMACDATQCRAFETTFCIRVVNHQQTGHGTNQ